MKARIFRIDPADIKEKSLQIPLWFWNSVEWCSFTQASARTQRPTLIQALRAARDGQTDAADSPTHDMRRYLRTWIATIRIEKNSGSPWGTYPRPKAFFEKIDRWKGSLEKDLQRFEGDEREVLQGLVDSIEKLCVPRRKQYPHYDFTKQEVEDLIEKTSAAHSQFGGMETDTVPLDVDAPLPFDGNSLLRSVEATAEMLNVSEYAETLLIRIRSLLTNTRMKAIMGDATGITLEGWLSDYIGAEGAAEGTVTILDLSLVPTEVIHTVTAVVARIVFEALQRYRKLNHDSLPTVIVVEEAHTFVRRYKEDAENQDAASSCCQVFERIAREGRKFGLGLVLSSQRPSEVSPTVLSQCNTFLLHRISNDRDQELVHRLVPDNLKGLLRELPSLPSQNAILLGWASELPVLVRMNDLPLAHQPQSSDPDFWDVWIGKDPDGKAVERKADWKPIADDWQGPRAAEEPTKGGGNEEVNEEHLK